MPNKKINNKQIAIFKGQKIRRLWDEKKEKWYFSIIDIIAILTEQTDHKKAKTYWTTLKNRLKNEGSEVVTKCDQLKMMAIDGKMRETDVADVETLLRLIQSVPSKKAEPIKIWLARVGSETRNLKVWKKIKLRPEKAAALPKTRAKNWRVKQAKKS